MEKLNTLQPLKRVDSLDAFRGVVASIIMILHYLISVPDLLSTSATFTLMGAAGWLLPYFFILSGYLLTLSYERRAGQPHRVRHFILDRAFRLYPVFILCTVAMFVIKLAFGAGSNLEGASSYFNIAWRLEPTINEFLHTLTMIGFANTWRFDGPAWTLVFEMRFAILFPLIFLMMRRSWLYMFLFVALSAVTTHLDSQLERVDIFYTVDTYRSGLYSMVHFLVFYLAGVAMALHRERVLKLYHSINTVVLMFVAVTFSFALLWIGYIVPAVAAQFVGNMIVMVGVIIWILLLMNNQALIQIFSNRLLVGLGRCSFSLYLWHTPIFVLNYLLMHTSVDVWVIFAISVVESFVVAKLSYEYIERRFIDLSKRLRK